MIKDTALASVVAMPDLLKQATQAQALAANPSPLIGAALIYLVICCRSSGGRRLERRFAAGLTAEDHPMHGPGIRPRPIPGLAGRGSTWTMPGAAMCLPASPTGCAISC